MRTIIERVGYLPSGQALQSRTDFPGALSYEI